MCPARRTHPKKRREQTRRWTIIVSVLLILATLAAVAYFGQTGKNEPPVTNVPEQQPTAFQAFTSHYVGVMGNLNSSETRTKMAAVLDPGYNQTDLFSWEASRLEFVQDPSGWREDPVDILSSGKGICTQWSIVYVSACLSLGYPSRLTVAVDTASWNFIHMWAEDYFNGSWLHVDPSDKVWNDPSRYQGWDWGKGIGGNVKIYTFEDGKYEEVTSNYGLRSG